MKIGRKKAKRIKCIPSGEDLRKFLDALPETPIITPDGARLIVITSCVAGLRVSEVLGLKPVDIDRQQETVRVERRWRRGDEDEPKSEASKRVRQIGALATELLSYARQKRRDDYIFTRPDRTPLDDRDLQRDVFRPAAEAVGIYHEGFGMHVFRRLNVTWRQQVGPAPVEAQKAAGHGSLDMTLIYTQTEAARTRARRQGPRALGHGHESAIEEGTTKCICAQPSSVRNGHGLGTGWCLVEAVK